MSPRAAVLVAGVMLLAACGPPRVPGPQSVQATILQEGTHRSFDAMLAPGAWYTIDFLMIVVPSGTSEVLADFETDGKTNVTAIGFTHPRSEIVQTEGPEKKLHVDVHCPGIGTHPLEISVSPPAAKGTIGSRATELTHFGFAFRSQGALPSRLHVDLRIVRSSVMLLLVGTLGGDAFDLDGAPARSPLRSAGAQPSCERPSSARFTSRCTNVRYEIPAWSAEAAKSSSSAICGFGFASST